MKYAVIYSENADVVGMYDSLAEATHVLERLVAARPGIEDEVGLRPYEAGRPAGAFKTAAVFLGDRIPQQHLASF